MADIFRYNIVNLSLAEVFSCHFIYFMQTLIELDLNYNKIGDQGVKYLVDAFKTNTVRFIFFILILLLKNNSLIQTLITLSLRANQIHAEGAQYLIDFFQNHKVVFIFYYSLGLYLQFVIQTVTTVDLGCNQIGVEGAKHLANAFQNNTVNIIITLSLVCIFIVVYRH